MIKEQEKPFIHLLRSPNSGYFFDVNRNEIVPVSDEAFQFLSQVMKDERLIDESAPEEILELKENRYLSSHHSTALLHPLTSKIESYLNENVVSLCLQVTQNCNLRCEYCIYSETSNKKQRSHTNKHMTLDIAKKAVDFYYNHSSNTREAAIGFYGGEPLLEMDLIRQIVSYAEDLFEGKRLLFNVTTNCTLLTPDVVDYMMAHNFAITISLDGPKRIHDRFRRFKDKGSFDKLIEHMQYIEKNYPDDLQKISISMVIDPHNDFDEINSVFNQFPMFKYLPINAAIVDDSYSEEKLEMPGKYIEKAQYQMFLGFLYMFERLDKEYVSPIVRPTVYKRFTDKDKWKKTVSLSNIGVAGGQCTPGSRRLFCTVDGRFFPCERVSESSEVMCIGSLNEGFNYEAIRNQLNVGKITEHECCSCWAVNNCMQCIRCADGEISLSSTERLSHCTKFQNDVEQLLLDIIMINEMEYMYR